MASKLLFLAPPAIVMSARVALDARMRAGNNVAQTGNELKAWLTGYFSGSGDASMRMFETAASSALAIAAQALVIGVIVSTL